MQSLYFIMHALMSLKVRDFFICFFPRLPFNVLSFIPVPRSSLQLASIKRQICSRYKICRSSCLHAPVVTQFPGKAKHCTEALFHALLHFFYLTLNVHFSWVKHASDVDFAWTQKLRICMSVATIPLCMVHVCVPEKTK